MSEQRGGYSDDEPDTPVHPNEYLRRQLREARLEIDRLRAQLDEAHSPFAYLIWDSRTDAPASTPYCTRDKAHQFAEMWNMGAGHERFTVKEVR